jgi:hypothetical protein
MKNLWQKSAAVALAATMVASIAAPHAQALEKRTIDEASVTKTTTSINGQLDVDAMDVIKVTVPENGELKVNIADAKSKGLSVMLASKLNPFYEYQFETLGDIFDYLRPLKLTDLEQALEQLMDESSIVNYGYNKQYMKESSDTLSLMSDGVLTVDKPYETFKTGVKKGTYYLIVSAASTKAPKDASYRLATKYETKKHIELESNQDRKSATTLPLNTTFTGQTNDLDAMDYYKVTVKESGQLNIRTATTNEDASLDYRLYDANRKTVKGFDTKVNRAWTVTKSSTFVEKGTYYVRVAGTEDDVFGHANYDIKATMATKTVKSANVQVNAAKNKVTFKALPVGATVNVYSDANKKKKLLSFKATSKTATKTVKLNKKGGSIYVALKKPSLAEGAVTKINYAKVK